MPKSKQQAESAAPKVPDGTAKAAENRMRDQLIQDPAPVSYKTGRIIPKAELSSMWQDMKRQGTCRIPDVADANPLTDPSASLEAHYRHPHTFSIFIPCVSLAAAGCAERSATGRINWSVATGCAERCHVCSLQATHSQFHLPGDLKCPKCNKAGVLTSKASGREPARC